MTYTSLNRHWRRIVAVLAVALTTVGLGAALTDDAAAANRHTPLGAVESIALVGTGAFELKGWIVDPDSTRSVRYEVLIDNKVADRVSYHYASKHRSDINRRYHRGSAHGVDIKISQMHNGSAIPAGKHNFCLKAANIGAGKNAVVGCRTYTVNYNPTGKITAATQVPGGVRIYGWAYDRSRPLSQISVVAAVNGVQVRTPATVKRGKGIVPAVAGQAHGFAVTVPVAKNGTFTLCVTGINIGAGSNARLPCITKSLNFSPTAAITSLVQAPGGFTIKGWATDPDRAGAALTVGVNVDGVRVATGPANKSGSPRSGHMATGTYTTTGGTHQVCLIAANAPGTPGGTASACKNISLNFNPTATITAVSQHPDGRVWVSGYATDPDTTAAVNVTLALNGTSAEQCKTSSTSSGTSTTVLANEADAGASHSGHRFTCIWPVQSSDGVRSVTATPNNLLAAGPGAAATAKASITLNYAPTGAIESITPATQRPIVVTGWAVDRNSTNPDPVSITATVDGVAVASTTPNTAKLPHAAVSDYAANSGFSLTLPTDAGEHSVCLTAQGDAVGTTTTSLGCKTIYAVKPTVPQAPANLSASSVYAGVAAVRWSPLARGTDGGGPMKSYTVRVRNASNALVKTVSVTVPTTTASISGLTAKATYKVSVLGTNSVGASAESAAVTVTIASAPPPQTTPAPVSTSRYVRNIHTGNATDVATMRSEGAADASRNPSGHRYLVLLQIGGQDHYDGGVVLSAGVRFVTYATVVANMESYIDGYASSQKTSAPVTIAIGTNNDMDVNATTGAEWANAVIDPVVAYASKYSGRITVAGANDIEPGFRASYSSSAAWLSGYLGATSAPFIFNGSADGCSWTATGKGCNNGWTMAGLYNLSAGAAPTRIVSLPQIYNTTMPKQWKYISLTGVVAGKTRVNFGGPLTEYTACSQAGSCGSIAGTTAWSQLWSQLQSDSRLKVSSVPYSTDLRIDS